MKIDDDQKVFKTSEEVCSIWLVWISISHSFACSKCEWTTSKWILLFRALRKAGMMSWHNSLREACHVFAGVCVHTSILQHACLIFESPSGDLRATALLHASVEWRRRRATTAGTTPRHLAQRFVAPLPFDDEQRMAKRTHTLQHTALNESHCATYF